MSAEGSRRAVIAAFVANVLIAAAKLVAAFITGSSAMLSEGFHSIADVGNQGFLLRGMALSQRPADSRHPFGRGKETYFWSFMVAVMLFVGGAALSFQHGLRTILEHHELPDFVPNFIVLGLAIVIEAFSFRVAFREFNRTRGHRSIWDMLRATKDSSILVVLLEDCAALVGLVVAAAGLGVTLVTRNPVWDGITSLVIAGLLAAVAIILATETKALLIGEAASRADRSAIRSSVLSLPQVSGVGRLLTMQLGPSDLLVNIEVDLADGISDAEATIDEVEAAVSKILPAARNIAVELRSRTSG